MPVRAGWGSGLAHHGRKLAGDPNTGLPHWQDKLFITMAGFAIEPSEHFQLPANRVVKLGEQMLI
ncbi:KUP/HAK/KT family potassium transporter|uniref:KUP/HAK/KT family potassium transporter n=1 Tax=Rhizobium altiplani TaxID=1864509 RepID=UPI0010422C87|nr:hypothetical protein [Rhizobium altiplani]